MSAVTRVRLVDDFQAKYLKFNGREPRTLHELVVAREEYRHRSRVAEIKAMAAKLELLDPFLAALAEQGIRLAWRDIDFRSSEKTLRIYPGMPSLQDDKLCAALLALGFHEVARSDYGRSTYQTVTLKHGRALLVTLDVTKAMSAEPELAPAAAAAGRTAS